MTALVKSCLSCSAANQMQCNTCMSCSITNFAFKIETQDQNMARQMRHATASTPSQVTTPLVQTASSSNTTTTPTSNHDACSDSDQDEEIKSPQKKLRKPKKRIGFYHRTPPSAVTQQLWISESVCLYCLMCL